MPTTDIRREVNGQLGRRVTADVGYRALLTTFDGDGRRGERSEEKKTCGGETEEGSESGHVVDGAWSDGLGFGCGTWEGRYGGELKEQDDDLPMGFYESLEHRYLDKIMFYIH